MVIWRGWGILAFLGIGLSVGLTALLAAATGTTMDGATWQGIPAFVIGGVAVYYLGIYLNRTRPDQVLAHERARAYGYVLPSGEAAPLNEQPGLTEEEGLLQRNLRNRHTLFFIPMQWWGVILPLIGIGISIATMTS